MKKTTAINQVFSTTKPVIPAQAGIQQKQHPAQRTKPLSRDARNTSTNWISACAGMTQVLGRSGFNPTFRATSLILALAAIGLATLPTHHAYANPQGGQVVAGSATIVQETAAKVGITQTTDKAIIDWQKYSIGASEHVQYYQPSAASVTLNRVVGQDPSQILGRLTANGQVFLVNPNGIFFGKNAQIDVAGLVASTHNIRNEDFLAGKYNFNIPGNPGAAVINEGNIRIADTGIAAFVAPSVANRGVIAARLGKIMLASASGFTLDFTGDELITFLVDDEVAQTAFDIEGKQLTSFVENAGRIEAQGGYVLLTAKAAENVVHSVINQSGSIEATSVGQQNGEIVLAGGVQGVVANTGTLDASGKAAGETGGKVQITGEKIGLFDGTRIDVSGDQGGGKAIVGGDYLGGKASDARMAEIGMVRESGDIQTATTVEVAENARIEANALSAGSGGKVVVWADDTLLYDGLIFAKGGSLSGNGGVVETSGKENLFVRGTVDAGALHGNGGYWLLDPLDAIVANSGGTILPSTITSALNSGTNYTLQTTSGSRPGSITVLDDIRKTSGGAATLNLYSDGAVIVNRGGRIVSTSGALDVNINARYGVTDPGYGLVAIGNDSNYAIETNGGQVDITGLIQTYQGKAIKTSGGQVLARTTPTSSDSDTRGFIGIGPVPTNATSAYTIDAGNGGIIMRATGGTITLDDHAMTANSVSLNGNVYARPNILAFNMADEATRSVIETGFGGSSGYGTSFPGNDDNSTQVNIASLSGAGLTLLGQNFGDFIYLSNNGYMRFDAGDGSFTPYSLSNTSNPIVSAYFGDVDTRGTGNVYYATHATSNDNKAVLTWIGTGYYSYGTDKTNTFQLQVENLGVESNVRLSYQQLQWTTGSASGGSGGLGGTVARAGIIIPGTNETLRFELPSSGRQTDMLALASLPGNTGMVGVWSFRLWPEATPPNYLNGRYEVTANTLTVNGSSSGHQLEKGIPSSSNVENADRRRTEDYLNHLLVERFAYRGPQEFVFTTLPDIIVIESNPGSDSGSDPTPPEGAADGTGAGTANYQSYIDTGLHVLTSDRASLLLQELSQLGGELDTTFKGFKYSLSIADANKELDKLAKMLAAANLDTREIEDIKVAIKAEGGRKGGLTKGLNGQLAKVGSLLGKVGKAAGNFAIAVDTADMVNKIFKDEVDIDDIEKYSHSLPGPALAMFAKGREVAKRAGAVSIALLTFTVKIAEVANGTSMSESLKTMASSADSIAKSEMANVSLAYEFGKNGKITREEYKNLVISLMDNKANNVRFLSNLIQKNTDRLSLSGWANSIISVATGDVGLKHEVMGGLTSVANEIAKIGMDDYMLLFDNGRMSFENGQKLNAVVGSAN